MTAFPPAATYNKIRLTARHGTEDLLDLVWQGGMTQTVFVAAGLEKSVADWIENGIDEWVGRGIDARSRHTTSDSPDFLPRLQGYLASQVPFRLMLVYT